MQKQQKQQTRAKKNWSKLRNIIKSGNLGHKKRQKKFNLFIKNIHHLQTQIITQYKYQNMVFFQKSPMPVFKELLHYQSNIDATGKWIWEAEEIAAYFFIHQANRIFQECLYVNCQLSKQKHCKQQDMSSLSQKKQNKCIQQKIGSDGYNNINILQLGSGCSGLASICLSQTIINSHPDLSLTLQLTDGQQQNIMYLQQNIKLNLHGRQQIKAKGYHLLWGDKSMKNTNNQQNILKENNDDRVKMFDIIIICDCLYFLEYQQDLVDSIVKYLSYGGTAFLINPKRGDSMLQFIKLLQKSNLYYQNIVFKNQKYEAQMHQLIKDKEFNEDKHLQMFTKVRKHNYLVQK